MQERLNLDRRDLEYAIKTGAKYEILKTQSPLLPLEKLREMFINKNGDRAEDRSAKDKLLTHIHDILEERGTHSELLNAIEEYKNGL